MNNKNLLIGLGVAVVAYYLYNQNQNKKLQTVPYTDAKLDKLITDLVNKSSAFALSKGIKVQDPQKGINETKTLFENAKTNGKDLSRANVDKFFKAYWIMILNKEGDKSQGVSTKEDSDLVTSFFNQPQPIQNSQGFFPNTPVYTQNNQINNFGITKEQCEKAGKKYTEVGIQCIKAPCGGGFGICE